MALPIARGLAPSAAGAPRARIAQPSGRIHFGAKNGAQTKQRVEVYWHTRKSPLSVPDKKRTSYERGSLTLPEFGSKNPNFPDLAQ